MTGAPTPSKSPSPPLAELGRALSALAVRLGALDAAAADLAALAMNADELATRAGGINAAGARNGPARLRELGDLLVHFAHDLAAAADNAARESAFTRDVAAALNDHASALGGTPLTFADVRARLTSLLGLLTKVPQRLDAGDQVAADLAALAARAADAAARALESTDGGDINRIAQGLWRELRGVADDAAGVSVRMREASLAARGIVASFADMSSGTRRDGPPRTVDPQARPEARLKGVIDFGLTSREWAGAGSGPGRIR